MCSVMKLLYISIHALHEESDIVGEGVYDVRYNFNPRSP